MRESHYQVAQILCCSRSVQDLGGIVHCWPFNIGNLSIISQNYIPNIKLIVVERCWVHNRDSFYIGDKTTWLEAVITSEVIAQTLR